MKTTLFFIAIFFSLLQLSCNNAPQGFKTIERDGVKIVCQMAGRGDTTLLFVHGAFIDMNYWKSQIEFFKNKYRVVVMDLPGHGKSGKNRDVWTMQEYGKDVCEVINQLELKNVVMIGHSMGGSIILEAAENCPGSIIGLVGVDNFKSAGADVPEELQGQIDQLLIMLEKDFAGTSESFARQVLVSSSTPESIAGRVTNDFKTMDKTIGIEVIKSAFEYSVRERELLNKLRFKLNLINVENLPTDKLLLEKNAHSGFAVFEVHATSHYPMIENPNEFNQILHGIVATMGKN